MFALDQMQARQNADEFIWDSIGSVEELGQLRMAAMTIEDVPHEFQRGGNQMMCLGRSASGSLR
jgi:hypothetical protein